MRLSSLPSDPPTTITASTYHLSRIHQHPPPLNTAIFALDHIFQSAQYPEITRNTHRKAEIAFLSRPRGRATYVRTLEHTYSALSIPLFTKHPAIRSIIAGFVLLAYFTLTFRETSWLSCLLKVIATTFGVSNYLNLSPVSGVPETFKSRCDSQKTESILKFNQVPIILKPINARPKPTWHLLRLRILPTLSPLIWIWAPTLLTKIIPTLQHQSNQQRLWKSICLCPFFRAEIALQNPGSCTLRSEELQRWFSNSCSSFDILLHRSGPTSQGRWRLKLLFLRMLDKI